MATPLLPMLHIPRILMVVGAVGGTALSLLYFEKKRRRARSCRNCTCHNRQSISDPLREAKLRRARLPSVIILIRHGESECNADNTLWREKPDNLISLTSVGVQQARDAGERIEGILTSLDQEAALAARIDSCQLCIPRPHRRIHLVVSPFERTLQTARALRPLLEHRIVRTDMEPRIREQEFGNLQGDEFKQFREEQKHIGRFWYRFPTGESGADVHDRVKSWWNESVLQVNQRVGYEPVDGLVVVTHGLTMRFVLMQLYNWSPTTFHSVWNAGNCNIYVLRKDLDKPGISPYVLDDVLGDMPKSSVSVTVGLRSGIEKTYLLHDYLSIPPPRTTRLEIMKEKLAQQHEDLNEQDIVSVRLVAFTSAGGASQSRTTTGRVRFSDLPSVPSTSTMIDSSEHPLPSQSGSKRGRKWVRPEQSCRFPNFSWPDDNESVDED